MAAKPCSARWYAVRPSPFSYGPRANCLSFPQILEGWVYAALACSYSTGESMRQIAGRTR